MSERFREVADILVSNESKDFVKRILRPEKYPVIKNKDGSVSTHKMSWGEADGKYRVYPTIVNKNGRLKRLSDKRAWDYANKTGEYIEFSSPEEADRFSKDYKIIWPK
jgi:hypothetical protein